MRHVRGGAGAARLLVAEINERMPRTPGNTLVPFSRIHRFVHTDRPLHEHAAAAVSPIEATIGEHVAALIEDGSTLQMGIGAIPARGDDAGSKPVRADAARARRSADRHRASRRAR